MKVQVTVELDFPKLDDAATRELAKQIVAEGHGLTVVRTVIVKPPADAGKPFTPKAGAPGSVLMRNGRAFAVWSQGPSRSELWVIPVDRLKGDTEVYLTSEGGNTATPYHGNGQRCQPTVTIEQPGYTRVETPCAHRFHKAVA